MIGPQALCAATFLLCASLASSFQPMQVQSSNKLSSSRLSMGFLDELKNRFLDSREGDFVKLDDYAEAYGPGPLLVLYNVPAGVTNEEIQDMVEDGAPQAFSKGVTLYRVDQINGSPDQQLDKPMQEVLEGMASGSIRDSYQPTSMAVTMASDPIVVTFFSGFSNSEMLATYNILGSEIYQEAQISPACAKAVPNAMEKPLRQVLEEIGGDHRDAMKMLEEEGQP